MRTLSPSSRLVLATILVALIALVLARSLSPDTQSGATAATESPNVTGAGVDLSGQPITSDPFASTVAPTSPTLTTPVACESTDQDRYVYNPDRLEVAAPCLYVTGTVGAVRTEADGDLHILLALDPSYTHLLKPANQGEELGDLVVEPVCVRSVTQTDAEAVCAADPDPLAQPFPVAGERVWMEGRYVFDLEHGGWAELHPLYRWGDLG